MKNHIKRIAIFSLAYYPFEGGAELAVRECVRRLPFDFSCFTNRFDSNWPTQEIIDGVAVTRLGHGVKNSSYYGRAGIKFFYIWRAWRAAEQAHARNPFNVIWAIMAAYGGLAAILFKMRHPSIPLVLTLQEGDSEQHILRRVGIFYILWRRIFKKADYIQTISNHLADLARRHGARCPIEVVPNGVDLEKIKNQKSKVKSLGPKEKVTIITTSRLVHKNGVDILIRAVARINNLQLTTYNLQLLIVGDGPERTGLEKLARDLDVADKIKFLGQVPADDIPEYLSQADIFARPSRSEGLGSSFLEAMAAGLPIIGTPVGGITDFLINYNTNATNQNANTANGLFANVDDPKDLAEKITLLINDNKLRHKLGANGRKLIEQSYQWDILVLKIKSIFDNLSKVYSSKPKVLLATGIFPPAIGGSASYSALLNKELPEHGFQVSVLTYGNKNDQRSSGNNVFIVSNRWPKGIRHLVYFLKVLILGRNADFVLVADSSFGAALMAALANRILGKKLIIRVTGDYAWEQGQQRFGVIDLMDAFQSKKYGWFVEFLRRCQTYALRRADIIIAPSQYLKGIIAGWGIAEDKIIVIYNGIDQMLKISKNRARHSLNLPMQAKITVSAGRLVPWKGFRVLIEAAAGISKEIPEFKLIIIGDGPERENLKSQIKNLKLETSVILTGLVPKDILNKYLSAADIFVLNTAYEGLSHQLLEALNAGLRVITTDAGGNREIINEIVKTHPDLIRVVSYNHKSEIASALEQELSKTKINSANLSDTMHKFSKEQMIDDLIQSLK